MPELFSSKNTGGCVQKEVKIKANRIKNSAFNLCTREDMEKFKREDFVGFMNWIGKLIPKDMAIESDLSDTIKTYLIFETKKKDDTDAK